MMNDEYSEEHTYITCTLTLEDGEEEYFNFYVNENTTDYDILQKAHEIALFDFGDYYELSFERD